MRQHGLTVITEILPDKVEDLRVLLNGIGQDIKDNPHIRFRELKTVHFMRWVILDATEVRGKRLPPQLVLSTNYDGCLAAHLRELTEKAENGLRLIYTHCKGFPRDADSIAMARYLRRRKRRNSAFYQGTMGRSVSQIHHEAALREGIEAYLQESKPSQNWKGDDPIALQEDIRRKVGNREDMAWSRRTYIAPFLQTLGPTVLAGGILAFLIALVACLICWTIPALIGLGAFVALVALWWTGLRAEERKDERNFKPVHQPAEKVNYLTRREDYKVQNQITHLVHVKPGFVRQFTLRFVLWAINLLAYTFYNKGELGGITSIHYARWAILDGGRRLLFFSNYDGSWESYLGEFVDRAAVGLTGVWSNTEGFPPTKNLIKQGARYSVEFKSWTRDKQIDTQVWYSAYMHLSVKNINNNTAIRTGLHECLDKGAAESYLRRL